MFSSILRVALPLAAQQGLSAAIARLRRKAVAGLAAILLLAAAFVFGMVALYALLRQEGFGAPEAAGLMAAALVVLAALVLMISAYRNRSAVRRYARASSGLDRDGPIGLVDQQASRLMQQVGPLTLLAAAFVIGLVAGRRR